MRSGFILHVHASDLDKEPPISTWRFFGAAAVKEKADYVKFLPEWAPVNLALSTGGSAGARGGGPRGRPGRLAGERRGAPGRA